MNKDRFKFRVWYKLYNGYVEERDHLVLLPNGILCEYDGVEIDSDNYIIEMCTGLKDKNGNLIYEGDIVAGRYFNPHHPKTPNPKIKGVVKFIQDRMTWIIENGDEGYDFDNCMPTKDCFEIIGNIHEQKNNK